VLVTVLISATMNAWFYVAFLLADIVYVVPQALVTALYAVSSAQPEVLARKARLTLSLAVIACIAANCVLFFGSRLLLGLFGPGYVEQGVWSLRILGLAAFPFFIKDHYISICRIQDRIAQALLPLTTGVLLELAASALGARLGGITGLSLGWLIALCIEALFMSRRVYKTIRPVSQQEVQGISYQGQMNENVLHVP
jgi:O-antigen/teichoic acid export membrane protein